MTAPTQDQVVEQKQSDKELNFRQLEAKYQRDLNQERQARLEAEKRAEQLSQRQEPEEEDRSDEPYIDEKRLEKKLKKFGQQNKQETQTEIQKAVHTALQEERKQNWIKTNADFYEVLQHAEKLAQAEPDLADTILEMPDGFERQKLVYKNIKALGLHKPTVKAPSIQDKIDSNRKGPYYQPSGIGTTPYASVGDFSASGQKDAYQKMKQLQRDLRI